jgi:hypothetical protein
MNAKKKKITTNTPMTVLATLTFGDAQKSTNTKKKASRKERKKEKTEFSIDVRS